MFSNLDEFFAFPYLIAVARTFNAILNKSSESGHLYFVPDLREKSFQFFTIEYDVIYGVVTFLPALLKVFIING